MGWEGACGSPHMNILASRVFAGWMWVLHRSGHQQGPENKNQWSSTSVSKQSGLIIVQYFKWQKRK